MRGLERVVEVTYEGVTIDRGREGGGERLVDEGFTSLVVQVFLVVLRVGLTWLLEVSSRRSRIGQSEGTIERGRLMVGIVVHGRRRRLKLMSDSVRN